MSSRRSLYQRLLAILFTLGLVVTLEDCNQWKVCIETQKQDI